MIPVTIKINKNKLVLLLVMCIAFIALGFWLATKDPNRGESEFSSEKTYYIGLVNLCLFSLLLVVFLIRLLDKNPGLKIDEEGIHNNTAVFGKKLFKWSDITRIEASTLGKKQVLYISYGQPKDFPLMHGNLACTFEEMEKAVMDAWKKQGGLVGTATKKRQ